MPRIIDRYVIREIIPPFLLALLVFTFILIIPFIIDLAEDMIAKGVPAGTILQLDGDAAAAGAGADHSDGAADRPARRPRPPVEPIANSW